MEEPQARNAEWKKFYTKEYMLYDLYEVLEQENIIFENNCGWWQEKDGLKRSMKEISGVIVIFCILTGIWNCTSVCTMNGT